MAMILHWYDCAKNNNNSNTFYKTDVVALDYITPYEAAAETSEAGMHVFFLMLPSPLVSKPALYTYDVFTFYVE